MSSLSEAFSLSWDTSLKPFTPKSDSIWFLPTISPLNHTVKLRDTRAHKDVRSYISTYAFVRTYVRACVHACVRAYAPTYARMYARTHARAYVRMFERTSLCARVCVSHVLPRLHTHSQNRINKYFLTKLELNIFSCQHLRKCTENCIENMYTI